MMSKFLHRATIALQAVLFLLSVGFLSYLSQSQQWKWFSVVLLVSFVLNLTVLLLAAEPASRLLKRLHRSEFRLALRFRECGVVDLYNMQIPDEQHERNQATAEIITEGSRFSLLSLTALSYIDPAVRRHWDVLRAKLDQGAPLRLLLLNPFSETKQVRDELNSQPRFDSKLRLEVLVGLYNKYSNVTIKFTSYSIYCAVFFSEDQMIYDPYHLGRIADRIENYFVALRLHDQTDHDARQPYFRILKSHFDYLWETADDIESFLQAYEVEIANTTSDLPQIRSRYRLHGAHDEL